MTEKRSARAYVFDTVLGCGACMAGGLSQMDSRRVANDPNFTYGSDIFTGQAAKCGALPTA